jgi:hypothetical protein
MASLRQKAVFWLKNNENTVLRVAVLAVVSLIFWLCSAKYLRYGYNGIDLAYFNQVFWNTIRGRWFFQTIHPHLSLGDHAELLIPLLTPLYALWQEPRMLLLLQAATLAACAWPVRLLARERLGTGLLPLGLALAWLANPLVHNIALFEFHVLPFAIFPLLMAALAYRRGARGGFALWSLAAMLAREDVALVVIMFSALAWLEKRGRWWLTVPFVFGSAWFVGAMTLVRHFAPAGGYKFAAYYAWLVPALSRPWEIAAHLCTLANLEMLLGFLMATAFLPLLSWRPLVLLLPPLAQIMLGAPGGGSLVLETHYASLFLPALTLASIDGYAAAPAALARFRRLLPLSGRETRVALPVFSAAVLLYAAVTLGPVPTSLLRALATRPPEAVAADAVVAAVPAEASVAASYALLPALSSREHLYAAHYLFLGVTQFAEQPYAVPEDLRYLAFDDRDLRFYAAQFPRTAWAAPHVDGGLGRLRNTAGAGVLTAEPFTLYDRRASAGTSDDTDAARTIPDTLPELPADAYLMLDGDRSIVLSQ